MGVFFGVRPLSPFEGVVEFNIVDERKSICTKQQTRERKLSRDPDGLLCGRPEASPGSIRGQSEAAKLAAWTMRADDSSAEERFAFEFRAAVEARLLLSYKKIGNPWLGRKIEVV